MPEKAHFKELLHMTIPSKKLCIQYKNFKPLNMCY